MQNNSLSYINPDAQIGKDVQIGPFCAIHENVVIGDGTQLGSHVSIMPGARIGKNCQIHKGAVVSSIPQDLKFKGEDSTTVIGDRTVIREFVTINRGTVDRHETTIGADCLLMAYVHVGHDCLVKDRVILVNSVQLAGHIEIGYHSIVGGASAVHQFVRIGEHTMVSGGSMVRKDVPHYVLAGRDPLRYDGINRRGLLRRNFGHEDVDSIKDIYRVVFQSGLNYSQSIKVLDQEIAPSEYRDKIIDFLKKSVESGRGLIKGPGR